MSAHSAVQAWRARFDWRREDCSRARPWTTDRWRCGHRPRRRLAFESSPQPVCQARHRLGPEASRWPVRTIPAQRQDPATSNRSNPNRPQAQALLRVSSGDKTHSQNGPELLLWLYLQRSFNLPCFGKPPLPDSRPSQTEDRRTRRPARRERVRRVIGNFGSKSPHCDCPAAEPPAQLALVPQPH